MMSKQKKREKAHIYITRFLPYFLMLSARQTTLRFWRHQHKVLSSLLVHPPSMQMSALPVVPNLISTHTNTKRTLSTSNPNPIQNEFYTLQPRQELGAEVSGIDLSSISELSDSLVEQIKNDVHNYEILIFRKQGANSENIIPPEKYVKSSFFLPPRMTK